MWRCTLVLTALLAVTSAAQAAPVAFYLGGSLGDGLDLDSGDLDLDLPDIGLDREDSTWKVFGGIAIGRVFAVEGAWHDFGRVNCCEGLTDAGFSLDVQGASVNAVAGIPIYRFRLFAKVGLIAWEADGNLLTFSGPVPVSFDGEDPMGGVGADLKLTEHFFVRAEWEVFQIEEGELDVASVGVQWRF
jgi:OOP family OmpA-OmpF porin